MSNNPFQQATKQQSRLRLALIGPSGSGKTYTALTLASALVPGGKIAVIDTERGSASKYADLFTFDVVELSNFAPANYIKMLQAAGQFEYDVIIIDSLSHAWSGVGGVLEIVDNETARSKSQNSYTAWRKGTPEHNALVDAVLAAPCHIIATMRSKTEYVLERDEKTGKTSPRKVGLAPVQRDGMEYEFDVVGDMDIDNTLLVTKSRCPALNRAVVNKPGQAVADQLRAWLTDGEPATPKPAETHPEPASGAVSLKPSEVNMLITYAKGLRPDLKKAGNIALNKSCLKACGLSDWTQPFEGGLEAAKQRVHARAMEKGQPEETPAESEQSGFPFPGDEQDSLEQPCVDCGKLTIRVSGNGEYRCQKCADEMMKAL